MKIFVTGAIGFIGYHLCKELLNKGNEVIGIDNFNSYYDPLLKEARLKDLYNYDSNKKFNFCKVDITDFLPLERLFNEYKPEFVFNLAAQAGVRYSIENPSKYIDSNLVGFGNILECCRNNYIKHLIYASSSSVYGGNTNMPFSENQVVDHPISLYAATKKSNELMAHAYSHLFNIPTTGLRFFTVYGPWGRPDMALFLFTKAIIENKPIKVFNNGQMIRDFTYIDDIVESMIRLMKKIPEIDNKFDKNNPDPSTSWAPYRIFNIGNSNPISLMKYINEIEKCLGLEAEKILLPMQAGDVAATASDCEKLEEWIGFKPKTSVKVGVKKFTDWYKKFYEIKK